MTDLLEILRTHDPRAGAAPDAVRAARLDAAIDELLAREADPAPAPRRRHLRGRAVAALAAGACAAGVLLGLPGPDADVGRPAPASAAATLDALARRAAAAPAQAGRYAYRRTVSYISHHRPDAAGGTYVVVLPHEEQEWIDAHGDGVVVGRIREDRPSFPTPADRAASERSPRVPFPDAGPLRVRDRRIAGLSAAQLAALPTDPVDLRRRLVEADLPAEQPVLAAAGQLLGSELTPPAVRVALYDVLRREPGARLEPDVADPNGRRGVGIAFRSPSWETTFLFDPGTGALLALRSVGLREEPGRRVTDWTLVLETRRTDDAPAARGIAPRLPLLPPPRRRGG
jgi:hypothetical protein